MEMDKPLILENSMVAPTCHQQTKKMFNDLKGLIHQIEENPDTSSWAIRLTLKMIVERGEKMIVEIKERSSVGIS